MCSASVNSFYLCNSFSFKLMTFSNELQDRRLIKSKSINLAKRNEHHFNKLSKKLSKVLVSLDTKFTLNKKQRINF